MEDSGQSRFVILCPARSGSTALREVLNSHPDICCHGELLGRRRILGYSDKGRIAAPLDERAYDVRRRNSVEFLEQYAFASDCVAVGFKLLYYQVGEVQFAEAMDYLAGREHMRYIVLWRRNLINRYLSEIAYTNQTIPTRSPDIAAVIQDCRNQVALRRRMEAQFPLDEAHHIDYEDLVANPRRVLDAVCRFLGVAEGKIDLPEKTPASRSKTDDLETSQLLSRMERHILRLNLYRHSELQPFIDCA